MLDDSLPPPGAQEKARCFGAKAALTVEATTLMLRGAPVGWTVNLDVAPRNGDSIDWHRKITLQLSETELPILAAVCLGYLPFADFKRPQSGLHIERQPGKLFLSATQGRGTAYSLPIPIGHTFLIGSLALKQLSKHTKLDDGSLLLASLRGASALHSVKAKRAVLDCNLRLPWGAWAFCSLGYAVNGRS